MLRLGSPLQVRGDDRQRRDYSLLSSCQPEPVPSFPSRSARRKHLHAEPANTSLDMSRMTPWTIDSPAGRSEHHHGDARVAQSNQVGEDSSAILPRTIPGRPVSMKSIGAIDEPSIVGATSSGPSGPSKIFTLMGVFTKFSNDPSRTGRRQGTSTPTRTEQDVRQFLQTSSVQGFHEQSA